MAVKNGPTQTLADALATAIDTEFSVGATNKINILNAAESTIASATDIDVTVSANVVSFASAGGVSITSTDTATGFDLLKSDDTVLFNFRNTVISVASGDQSTGADTFTETSHGLVKGQLVVVGGSIPTTTPAISDGDSVFVTTVTANSFQVERSPGAGAVDIGTAAVSDTTFTLPTAVGSSGSGAILEITGGTSLTSGNTITLNTMSVTVPIDNLVSNQ